MPGEPIQIGPFVGGLNTYSDPTAVADNQVVECVNFEPDLDGSLVSRPPVVALGTPAALPLSVSGNPRVVGTFYGPGGTPYIIASDGLSATYYFTGGSWTLITSTFAAQAMVQFNDKAWLLAPVGSANPGGSWSPAGSFVAEPNMPKGDSVVAMKNRLWVVSGKDAVANGTRMYFSKVLGQTPFWQVAPDFIDVGSGDGQNIVALLVYFNSLIIFRTKSIYSFQYTSDPASGIVSQIVPGVGLNDALAIAVADSYVYFTYQDRAYEFYNNRARQLNVSVVFESVNRIGIYAPYSVSIFNNRVLFQHWDVTYVYHLKTQTWTVWRTTVFSAFGPITEQNRTTDNAVGLLFSARSVPATAIVTQNRVRNSKVGAATTDYVIEVTTGVASLARVATGGPLTAAPSFARATVTTAEPTYLRINNADIATNAVTAGQPYRFSAKLRRSTAGNVAVYIQWLDSGGAAAGSTVLTTVAAAANTWTDVTVTGTAPAGAVRARLISQLTGAAAVGVTLDTTALIFTQGTTVYPWFDGSLIDALGIYTWDGTVDLSTSTMRLPRPAPTLRIEDGVTNAKESMQCILQTKNYDYEAASVYKRLFWWGANAVFRGRVVAIVTPITYNYSVTWGQLLTTTWGQLLNFTWGQPLAGTLSVQTTRDTAGSGSMRKFVKFMKSLRFRQVNFRVVFDTDGSIDTAPVRLFSLMTYVRAKEKVSKTVT